MDRGFLKKMLSSVKKCTFEQNKDFNAFWVMVSLTPLPMCTAMLCFVLHCCMSEFQVLTWERRSARNLSAK